MNSRRIRHRRGLCLVEGPRAIREAAISGCLQFTVAVDPIPDGVFDQAAVMATAPLFSLAEDFFSQVVDVVQSQGVLGVARIPSWSEADLPPTAVPSLLLYLDGLREPGNVGALIRTAWALGAGGVLLAPGTADPFGPKAIRASAGGVFHVPVVGVTEPEPLAAFLEEGYLLYLAEGRGRAYDEVQFGPRAILALGNETAGISPWLAGKGIPVAVPMAPGVDSLNVVVAGSIIAAEMIRLIRDPKSKI